MDLVSHQRRCLQVFGGQRADPAGPPAAMMPSRALLGGCLLSLALRHTQAQVRVMAPESLVQEFAEMHGRIDGSTATFGAPFYGLRLLGRLVWGESLRYQQHCKEDDYEVPPPEEIQDQSSSDKKVRLNHIIMVRRGMCSFVTKVNVARAKGAHAVIIVDRENSNLTKRDIRKTIMADDGYGSNIDIPSILISNEEGQRLIDATKKSKVILELAWDVPTNHVVVVDLWLSSASHESLRFLQEFSSKRRSLNEKVKFVPHYHVFSMQSSAAYRQLCTDEDGRYCAEDPDGLGYITGKMVLEEDVRQLCIHQLTKVLRDDLDGPGSSDSAARVAYAAKFWDYVEAFLKSCPLDAAAEPRFGRECAENLMRKVSIDVQMVSRCMNRTLETKLKQERENIAWSPRALRINGWRYQGTLDADLVTRAICAAFTRQPAACTSLVEPVNPFRDKRAQPGSGVGFLTFLAALVAVSCIILSALALYKRSLTRHIHSALREEVMLEVQAQMDSYKQCPT